MPTYEYKCKSCGHTLELFQSMKDAPKRKCPDCGKNTLERLIGTGAALIFKGSGFYQTDYRSESYKKAADADKPAAPAETKAEKKAEPKAEAKGGDAQAKDSKTTEQTPVAAPAASKPQTSVASKSAAKRKGLAASSPKSKPQSKTKPR